jgi:hypothetical protein
MFDQLNALRSSRRRDEVSDLGRSSYFQVAEPIPS